MLELLKEVPLLVWGFTAIQALLATAGALGLFH